MAQKELAPVERKETASKLDDYKDHIDKRIKTVASRIPSNVLLQEIAAQGYTGKIRILQEYLTIQYRERIKDDPLIRYETNPGEQTQIDWTVIRSGKYPIYAFVATLGYSRVTFVYFTDNMDTTTFIECHKLALSYFGGATKTILYDNLKSVVVERNAYGKGEHKFNDLFMDFAKSIAFIPKLCKPYRAKTKDKVERFNGYLKANFYRPLVGKLQDSGIEITADLLNSYINPWLSTANNRIHGTTKKVPFVLLKEEVGSLVPFIHVTPVVLNATKMNF